MILITCILSLVFGSIAFLVNQDNAKYVLSGYNTMSESDRAKVDIGSYIKLFKRFHIFLGLSLLAGVLILTMINNNWASLYLTTYPLIAYVYLVIVGGKSINNVSTAKKVASYVVCGILILIVSLITLQGLSDYKSSDLILTGNTLEINGSYGIKFNKQEIYKQELVNELPAISYKSNGFAAGDYAKGRFKTKDGNTVRLYVNKKVKPILLLHTKQGDTYYSADTSNMHQLSKRIAEWLKQ